MDTDPHPTPHRRRVGLRLQVLLPVNLVLVAGLTLLLASDFQRGVDARVRGRGAELEEEAALVLAASEALSHHGLPAVQAYIDEACGWMRRSTSPDHRIRVRLGGVELRAIHEPDPDQNDAAAAAEDRVSGTRRNGETQVWVSESTGTVRADARRVLLRRSAAMAAVALGLTLLVNLLLTLLVVRPVHRIAGVVRSIGQGNVDARPTAFRTRELDGLAREVTRMGEGLERATADRKARAQKAREVQRNLMPAADELERHGVLAAYEPAEEVGGDFLDLRPRDDGGYLLYVGDVTGHGISAAMGASMLKVLFEAADADTDDPAEILDRVNKAFFRVTLPGVFATLFVVLADPARRRWVHASAGHEIGFLRRRDGRAEVEELGSTGLPLGVIGDERYESGEHAMEEGDLLVLMTDGLTEAMDARGRLLGRGPIRACVQAEGGGAEAIFASITRAASAFRGDEPAKDDLTLVLATAPPA